MKKLLLIVMMSASWNYNMHAMDTHHQKTVYDGSEYYIKVGPVNWGALTSNMAAIQQGSELQELCKKEDEESSESTDGSLREEDLKFYQTANEWHREALEQRVEEKRQIEQAKERIKEERPIQQENSSVSSALSNHKEENQSLALVVVEKKPLGVRAKRQLQLTNKPDPEDWDDLGTGKDDDEGWGDEHWVDITKDDNKDDNKQKQD
jgi:hypothetical protein